MSSSAKRLLATPVTKHQFLKTGSGASATIGAYALKGGAANAASAFGVPRSLPRRRGILVLWTLVIIAILGAYSPSDGFADTLKIGGTGDDLGTMQLLGDAFERSHPDASVKVLPSLGSGDGFKTIARVKFVEVFKNVWSRAGIAVLAALFLLLPLRTLARALKRLEAANDHLMEELSARQRVEQALRKSEARAAKAQQQLLDAVESIAASFILYDADERLVLCNSKAREFLPEVAEFLVPGARFEDLARSRAETAAISATAVGRVEDWVRERVGQFRHPGSAIEEQHAGGRWTQVRERRTADGGTVCIHTDITELKRAEEAIRKLSRHNELILSAAGEGIYGLDLKGRITFVNPAAARMVGWQPEELIGQPEHDILYHIKPDGSPYPHEDCPIHAAFEDGELHHVSDEVFWRKDGTSFPVEYTSTPIREFGELVGAVVVYRDISERRRAEERLEQALKKERDYNQLQRQFVSMASHEIRTPLAIIDGSAQRIIRRKDNMTRIELVEKADKIRSAVGRMTALIESFLSMARFDAGKVEMNPEPCDLAKLIETVCERQAGISKSHDVSIDVSGLASNIVIADPKLLDQVFTNLVSNAVKYSPSDPRVEVRAWTEGDHVAVAVRDYGVGIPTDDLPQLFTRFFRAGTATGIAGSGIGLYLVKQLVDMHRGRIDVESVKGEGSIFTLRLDSDLMRRMDPEHSSSRFDQAGEVRSRGGETAVAQSA